MKKGIKTVDAYIAKAPQGVRAKLRQIRAIIKTAAPGAEEKISYGMPYYAYHGRLVYFAAAKHHIGFYALPTAVETHIKQLKNYQTSKATIQFPLDEPLPVALIKRLVAYRVKENERKAKK